MTINNGGLAYPVVKHINANGHEVGSNGLTKRAVIAKDAMVGLLANRTQVTGLETVSNVVGWSIKYADELIKQLAETEAG